MASGLKLVIFDVDGTLVDSQTDILAAMGAAFEAVNLPTPPRARILGVVGLSLDVAMQSIAPDVAVAARHRMVSAYKEAYVALRAQIGAAESSPLYPGARETLEHLHANPEVLLGVATGKSRRGLDKLIEAHGLDRYFVTQQVADHHPSKPHPSMILTAMSEVGVEAGDCVMVGDTRFDMEMARAAGVRGLGVSWGYHPIHQLTAAHEVLPTFDALQDAIMTVWSQPT